MRADERTLSEVSRALRFSRCMLAVRHGAVFHVAAPGCTVVQANWKHWPCLLPQHGPGRPCWQFSNVSEDILQLCGWALDLVDIAWRRSSRKHISVSRREAVARLDELIGLKS